MKFISRLLDYLSVRRKNYLYFDIFLCPAAVRIHYVHNCNNCLSLSAMYSDLHCEAIISFFTN